MCDKEFLDSLHTTSNLVSKVMGTAQSKTATEQEQIDCSRESLKQTRVLTATLEARIDRLETQLQKSGTAINHQQPVQDEPSVWPLQPDEYQRYGRQMIMPEIGLEGWLVPLSLRVVPDSCVD